MRLKYGWNLVINLPLTDVARAPSAAYMGTLQHMIHERTARASSTHSGAMRYDILSSHGHLVGPLWSIHNYIHLCEYKLTYPSPHISMLTRWTCLVCFASRRRQATLRLGVRGIVASIQMSVVMNWPSLDSKNRQAWNNWAATRDMWHSIAEVD